MRDELLSWVCAPGGPARYSTGPGDWAEWTGAYQPNSGHKALWGIWDSSGTLSLSREAGNFAEVPMDTVSVHLTDTLCLFRPSLIHVVSLCAWQASNLRSLIPCYLWRLGSIDNIGQVSMEIRLSIHCMHPDAMDYYVYSGAAQAVQIAAPIWGGQTELFHTTGFTWFVTSKS